MSTTNDPRRWMGIEIRTNEVAYHSYGDIPTGEETGVVSRATEERRQGSACENLTEFLNE